MEFHVAFIKRTIAVLFSFFYLHFSGFAQVKTDDILFYSKHISALKNKANKAFNDGDYLLAQLYYETLVQKKPSVEKYQFQLAKTYQQNKLYAQAESAYLKAKEYNHSALLHLSAVQIAQGKYTEARKNFDAFKKSTKGKIVTEDEVVYKNVQVVLKNAAFLHKDSLASPKIVRLNKLVNGKLSEFSAFYLNDTTFFFGKTSPDEATFFLKSDSQTSNIPVRRFYTGKINENGDVSNTEKWTIANMDSIANMGGACFNADKSVFYFTQCERKFNTLECHIYQAKKSTSGWSKAHQLEGKINTPGYTSAQPSLGYDSEKKAEVLYFSSNMPGAKGFDIYYALYDKSKRQFTSVSKCGAKINSAGDEYTPFYVTSDSTLYFSSNGKGGFGGQDIFKAKGKLNNFSEPQALASPINSPADDDYFSLHTNKQKGFFASNRSSESSTAIKTCCDDLYAFYLPSITTETKNAIKEAPVSQPIQVPLKVNFENGFIAQDSAKLSISNADNNSNTPIHSSSLYNIDTTLVLQSNHRYKFTVTSKNHLTETREIDLNKTNSLKIDTITLSPKLIPKKAIVIPGIVYEYDSTRLTTESIQKIDEYIYSLLIENPKLTFQINSHTDSKGNDAYNQKLSEQRAKSVVDYLTQVKGISQDRLKYKGFGETKPIAPNSLPNGADNPEGRAQNRRTEFEVIGGLE